MTSTPTIKWVGDAHEGHVEMIDQTRLPGELALLDVRTREDMWHAIKRLSIRGAPAIGIAAAYGLVLGLQGFDADDRGKVRAEAHRVGDYIKTSRPTAVNLAWAIDRLLAQLDASGADGALQAREALFAEAQALRAEDETICDLLGACGADLVDDGDRLLTHCNAGALATGGSGTALSVMFAAKGRGTRFEVYVDETRPLLQGARLTAWELMHAEIDATLICDNMAAHVMRTRGIHKVFVGADRIAGNGDTANKIGTYSVAVLARAHDVPFYVVAPESTFDLSLPDGSHIPIEERSGEEIVAGFGSRTAPEGVRTYSPAFDVTPAGLITGIVTEKGLITPVNRKTVAAVLSRPRLSL